MFNLVKENSQRFITGTILLAVVLAVGLIDNYFLTWLFFGVIFMFAFYETLKLLKMDSHNNLFFWALMIWIVAYFYPNPDDLFFVIAIIFASFLAYHKDYDLRNFLPFLYPTSSFLFLLALYHDFGMDSLIWLLIVVASTDIGAFFIGKLIGKTQFSKTSPNKTLEGAVGGVALATFLGSFYALILVDLPYAIIISLLVSIASIFGDLFESYLKRRVNVKDSGNILPGHGGILDRVDGYLFAAPAMVILLRGLL
ncbi:phosphatidate cytidylyltransferase [Nitrosophilus kaiyonis]|uniref:phosphatidate cytidylyltransferase n=1 Tax=Nitrosophilus kaiyonis TaxID=2930200 RepID=UPI002490591A|nr:phosphatidate cytidylyltransferase [Nitrosophilus kaiyonis]